jgi:hypothetical protein
MTQRSMRYIYSKIFSVFALLSPSLVSAVEAFNSALVELSSILGNQGILKKLPGVGLNAQARRML